MRTVRFSGHLFGGGVMELGASAWGCLPRGVDTPTVDRQALVITLPRHKLRLGGVSIAAKGDRIDFIFLALPFS